MSRAPSPCCWQSATLIGYRRCAVVPRPDRRDGHASKGVLRAGDDAVPVRPGHTLFRLGAVCGRASDTRPRSSREDDLQPDRPAADPLCLQSPLPRAPLRSRRFLCRRPHPRSPYNAAHRRRQDRRGNATSSIRPTTPFCTPCKTLVSISLAFDASISRHLRRLRDIGVIKRNRYPQHSTTVGSQAGLSHIAFSSLAKLGRTRFVCDSPGVTRD
jgi:hypothetical protein